MKPSPWLACGLALVLASAVATLLVGPVKPRPASQPIAPDGRAPPAARDRPAAPTTGAAPSRAKHPATAPAASVRTAAADRRRAATAAPRSSSPSPPRDRRSSRPAAAADLILRNLAPGMEVTQGTIKGSVIDGPVVATGSQGGSAILSATAAPADAVGGTDNLVVFRFGPSDDARYVGDFVVEAAAARATPEGIRYLGPLTLKLQNGYGHWYEFASPSAESSLFISRDGLRKVFAAPKGGSFPEVSQPADPPP